MLVTRQRPVHRGRTPTPGGEISGVPCDYESVATAVAAANPGDTVTVNAGSSTWPSSLTITKRIKLIGAGIGNTVITAGAGLSTLISYLPSDTFSSDYFRLSGFTLDNNDTACTLFYANRWPATTPSWMRLDHNRFVGRTATTRQVIEVGGRAYGVIDHNTFDHIGHTDNYGKDDPGGMWATYTFEPGTAYNLYYEDNTWNFDTRNETVASGGKGGRYCYRYNTFNLYASGSYTLFDAHGNQTGGIDGTQGMELYGNRVVNYGAQLFGWRGGKAMVFFNKIVPASSILGSIADDVSDSIATNPTDLSGDPQRPNHQYYWNNRYNGVLRAPAETTDVDNALAENQNWWNHQTSFDGSVGMGCGTLAARPASASAVGVGYWATDQDCTQIEDKYVGVRTTGSETISGTLYVWDGASWGTGYFTPYTYPHPFTA